MEVTSELTAIISTINGNTIVSIGPDATIDSLKLDSFDRVELIMMVEDRFNIRIEDEEADKVQTFGQLVELVEGKRDGLR